MKTPGWATLVTILQESGERPPKRPWPQDSFPRGNGQSLSRSESPNSDSEHLTKRFRGATLE